MKRLLLTLSLTISAQAFAHEALKMVTREIPLETGLKSSYNLESLQRVDPGKVIATAKDVIALGEQVYTIVQKGTPTNTIEYSPISIVPRDPQTRQAVDPFELESCSMPTKRAYETTMSTGGTVVVRFKYIVVYTYNCSFNGKGKFIQSALVQPVSAMTSYGWEFNATMKLQSMMNHGTKDSPVVGAFISMKYTMKSWRTAFERNDTIHITGRGEVNNYSN